MHLPGKAALWRGEGPGEGAPIIRRERLSGKLLAVSIVKSHLHFLARLRIAVPAICIRMHENAFEVDGLAGSVDATVGEEKRTLHLLRLAGVAVKIQVSQWCRKHHRLSLPTCHCNNGRCRLCEMRHLQQK